MCSVRVCSCELSECNAGFIENSMQILIPDVGPEMVLSIKVMDYDLIGKDELMGEYEIVLDKSNEEAGFLRDSSETYPLRVQMLPGRKKGKMRKTGKARGELHMTLQHTPFFNADAEQTAADTGGNDAAKSMEAAAVCPLQLSIVLLLAVLSGFSCCDCGAFKYLRKSYQLARLFTVLPFSA